MAALGTDIGAIAGAIQEVAKLTHEIIHKTQRERIDGLVKQCQADDQAFADAVLAGDAGSCRVLVDGLRHDGPAPLLTARQYERLSSISLTIDGAFLLRLYCLAREGDLAQGTIDVLTTTKAE